MVQTSGRIDRRRRATDRAGARRRRILLYGAAAVTIAAVVIGALLVGRTVAHDEAFRNAGKLTTELADQVGPLITDAANGDPTQSANLNRIIADRKHAGFLKLVTIWGADGGVIYSDDARQIGRRLTPPDEVTLAITEGTVSADFAVQPEVDQGSLDVNVDGPGFVEVYVPLALPNGTRVAFEAYYDYPQAAADADQLFRQFLPLVLGLLLLLIIQLPIAVLVRRIRRRRAERLGLPENIFSGTGKERIQVAANLHDGPIQDIAGVGYALGAVALSVPEHGQPMMRQAQQSLQRAQQSLRRLMVDLYPLDLTAAQLPAAITSLAGPLRQHGIDVLTTFEPLPALPDDLVHALYQGAHEALANVAEHAHATHVDVDLSMDADRPGVPFVRLRIADDGVGFDAYNTAAQTDGRGGLRVLGHRLTELGGSLTLVTRPGHGTTLRIELPSAGDHSA
jgi:two-component system NarL family sensor kinase